MKIRHLRYDTNGAQDSERRGQDAVTHARHHVTPTSSYFVHGNDQCHTRFFDSAELARSEPVSVYDTARALQPQQDLITGLRVGKHSRYFLAQGFNLRGHHVALEA